MLVGRSVIVIGAGVGGLAVAAALAQKGVNVRVFERASALDRVGAGLQISPNGAAVLNALGIDPMSIGIVSDAVELRNHSNARRVLRLDLTTNPWHHPFILTHRADLISTLAHAATDAGAKVEMGVSADPTTIDADLIVAADGIKSGCRCLLNGKDMARFTGQVAWRAIVSDGGAPEAHVYMGPGRHLVTYPVGGGLRNIVAVEERVEWAEEGWDHPDNPENLCAAFTDFSPVVRGWLDQVEEVKLWGLFSHPVAPNWTDGRLVLLGDAAHPTLPFLAQGANLALEDAWVLAKRLASMDPSEALAAFQNERKPRVAKAIAAANANARNYHLRNPLLRGIAHSALRAGGVFAPNLMLKRFDWLYGFDPVR